MILPLKTIKRQIMKKIFGLLIFMLSFSCASVMAQQTEMKVKPKTTVGDKAHNVFHRRHKRHHGYKYKYKHKRSTSKVMYLKPEETYVATA